MSTRPIWVPALLTFALVALGFAVDSRALMQTWLAVVLTWGMLPLGAVAVLMTHRLTGGRWGEISRPIWEALAATMPLFAVSLLPLLFGLEVLFSWTQPVELLPEVVQNKRLYLYEPFFISRTLFYLLIWLGLSWTQGGLDYCQRFATIRFPAAAGLILWVFTITFFGFDWFMSLEPKFYSDVFGLMLCMNAVGAAMAAGILFNPATRTDGVAIDARCDIANLWLTVLLGWALMAFSQYIIIWSGNLPDEIGWYIHRSIGAWRTVSVLSFGLFFLLPFLVLLSGAAKANRGWLVAAAVVCLCGHVLQILWLVLPAFDGWQGIQFVLVPGLMLTVGATYAGCVFYVLTIMNAKLRPSTDNRNVGGSHA